MTRPDLNAAAPPAPPTRAERIQRYEHIPHALRVRPHWMFWDPASRYQPKAPRIYDRASGKLEIRDAHNLDHHLDFEDAVEIARELGCGLGYVITDDTPGDLSLLCVDIDGRLEDHELALPQAEQLAMLEERITFQVQIASFLGAYAERSPSGSGIHIWFYGRLPFDGTKRHPVEIYKHRRFMTMTGDRLPWSPEQIGTVDQAKIDALLLKYFPDTSEPGQVRAGPAPSVEIVMPRGFRPRPIRRIITGHNSPMYLDIYENEGAWRTHTRLNRATGELEQRYPTQSEADYALINAIARGVAGNAFATDYYFRQSALMRAKYDEQRGSRTYGQRLVDEAVRNYLADTEATRAQRRRPPERR